MAWTSSFLSSAVVTMFRLDRFDHALGKRIIIVANTRKAFIRRLRREYPALTEQDAEALTDKISEKAEVAQR